MGNTPLQSRNSEIDAWRGISILMVISGHLTIFRYQSAFHLTALHSLRSATLLDVVKQILLRFTLPLPTLGVSVFFVISGYLITAILLREEEQYHSISIAAFYARRVFRIIPAFAVYILFIAAMAFLGFLHLPGLSFLKAGLFLGDTSLGGDSWWLGHAWTLSVEEQFYLVWPLAFSLLSRDNRGRCLMAAYVVLIGISYIPALSRIWLTWTQQSALVVGVAFPCILAGAVYASSKDAMCAVDRFATGNRILAAALMLLMQPLFASVPVIAILMRPFIPLLIAFVFFGSLRKRSIFSAFLSARWLSWIGLISYSLYLWQEYFTGSLAEGGGAMAHWTILCVPIAAISYLVIERPMIRIGHRISRDIIARGFERHQRLNPSFVAAGPTTTSVPFSQQ